MQKSIVSVALALVIAACGNNRAAAQTSTATSGGETTAATPPIQTDSSPAGGAPAGRQQLSELEFKRIVSSIKSDIPTHKAKFKELCGGDVAIDIDWASFGRDQEALKRLWGNVGVERLVAAFRHVCVDAAGKDAVKAKVKTIRAVNVWEKDKVRATLSGGTFTAELMFGFMPPGMNENDLAGALIKAL